ncbi:MAG: hypothetical protein O2826_11500 [Chloroflexi bacterium]|nr:hypothetical protein [Chloroflexota bacterium]
MPAKTGLPKVSATRFCGAALFRKRSTPKCCSIPYTPSTIDDRLGDAWTRWLTAHALGHHVLHVGASLYLEDWQWVNRNKAERQAEEFAAGLLAGPAPRRPATPKGLARRLGIPEPKAEFVIAQIPTPSAGA